MSDSTADKKLIERIKKLIALASNNSNEAEALLAMNKAQELLAEHDLELSSLGNIHKSETIRDADLLTDYSGWVKVLMT